MSPERRVHVLARADRPRLLAYVWALVTSHQVLLGVCVKVRPHRSHCRKQLALESGGAPDEGGHHDDECGSHDLNQ